MTPELGTVSAVARFADPAVAKAAWERVTAVSRGITVYRLIYPCEGMDHWIVMLGESQHAAQLEEHLMRVLEMGGTHVTDPPARVITIARARRAEHAASSDGKRRTVRYPRGRIVDERGRDLL